jgi:hypothetical protein
MDRAKGEFGTLKDVPNFTINVLARFPMEGEGEVKESTKMR